MGSCRMIKRFLLLFTLLAVSAGVLRGAETDAQPLRDAADLYFSYKPKQALEKYLEISKQTGARDAFLNAAFIALEQGQTKQAVDIMSAALKLFPDDQPVLELAAEAYLTDGQFVNAENLLSSVTPQEEGNELYYINLARAQAGMGETALAVFNLKTAAAGKYHTALSNYLLGQLYAKQGQWQQAADALKISVAYDHQFLEARRLYAEALDKLGKYNEAWRHYRMIYSMEKNIPAVNKAIEALRPKLTKKETELEARKEGRKHTFVRPVLSSEGTLRTLRVGLGATNTGRPTSRATVAFSPSHDFEVISTATGKKIASGKAKEEWSVSLANGKAYVVTAKGKKIPFTGSVKITQKNPSDMEGTTIIVRNVLSGAGMTWVSVDDKEYRGVLEVIYNKKRNTLVPVNHVSVEEYLMGVMSSEMPVKFPLNALRSQAVLARTYALRQDGKHASYGYDVCDTQNCQVYGGVGSESEQGNAAVESTMGQVLLYKNKPIESVFSANCGGSTQSAKEAGWFSTPYLNPVSDYKDFDFDNLQPYQLKNLLQHPYDAYSRYDKNVSMAAFRWVRVVDEQDLRQIIKKQKKDIGAIVALVPLQRGHSGYVSKLLVKGTNGEVVLDKENVIRRNLSLGMLRSSYFIVQPNYEDRKLKNFVFYGGGWGHGVGFCQTGAAGRAEAGQPYTDILQHYFPLATMTDIRQKTE